VNRRNMDPLRMTINATVPTAELTWRWEKGWRLKTEGVKMITWWRGYGIWRFHGVPWLLWPKSAKYQTLEPSELIVDVYYKDPPQPSSLPTNSNLQIFTTITLLTTFLSYFTRLTINFSSFYSTLSLYLPFKFWPFWVNYCIASLHFSYDFEFWIYD